MNRILRKPLERLLAVSVLLVSGLCGLAPAQLRVVSYNTLDKPSSPSNSDFQTILSAIGTESVNGIAKRVDVIALQEQTGNDVSGTAVNLANLLNNLYGVSSYVGLVPSGQLSTDRQGIVYDSSTLTLLSTAVIPSGGVRPLVRFQLRPVGYDSPDAAFYLYSIHLKAGNTADDRATRATETATLRANIDALGSAHVIVAGDFNVYASSETAYQNLVAVGANPQGQLFDPINKPGSWSGNSSFAINHTQSTRTTQLPDGGASGGMDDRFDFQLVSGQWMDGNGLSYIGPTAPGTSATHAYRAFGNAGNTFNGNINDPQNTSKPAGVLNALYNASDHLPVVADYQVPAKMSVSVGAVPSTVIVGAAVSVPVTVSNSANVVAAVGADELIYSGSGTGGVLGSFSGVDYALGGANSHSLSLNTATAGPVSGQVLVTSTSQAVQSGSFSQNVSATVLDHSQASFSAGVDQDVLTIDFGKVVVNSGTRTMPFAVHNLVGTPGFTAALDIDAVNGSGDTGRLYTNLTPVANIPAGSSSGFLATLNPNLAGPLSATYQVSVSDQNLPGATAGATLTINLTATVIVRGDFNADGIVNWQDIDLLGANLGGGDMLYDLTGDNAVNFADVKEMVYGVLNTRFGDNNTDGLVDLDNDLPLFLTGYGGGGSGWYYGDYTLNGAIDLDNDFALFVDGYNGLGGSPLALVAAIEAAGLDGNVPEPSALGLLALAGGLLGRRGRR